MPVAVRIVVCSHPNQALKPVLLAFFCREGGLQFDKRQIAALRDDPVAIADEVNRQMGFAQKIRDEFPRLVGFQRKWPVRQNGVTSLQKFTPDAIPLPFEVRRDIRQIDHPPGIVDCGSMSCLAASHLLENAGDLVGEIINPLEVVALGLMPELLVILPNPTSLGVDVKELKPEKAIEYIMSGSASANYPESTRGFGET